MARTKTETKSRISKVPTNGEQPTTNVRIKPPNQQAIKTKITGTKPYAQQCMSEKKRQMLIASHEAGSQASGKKKKKPPRDFNEDYEGSFHKSTEGWPGIPCTQIKAAMVRACKLVGFVMTDAKITFFVEGEGYDAATGEDLIRIYGKPEKWMCTVRNDDGSLDLRCRPRWQEWYATVTIRYNADFFNENELINLLAQAGAFVGIGEGRPNAKKSCGLGMGLFKPETPDEV